MLDFFKERFVSALPDFPLQPATAEESSDQSLDLCGSSLFLLITFPLLPCYPGFIQELGFGRLGSGEHFFTLNCGLNLKMSWPGTKIYITAESKNKVMYAITEVYN